MVLKHRIKTAIIVFILTCSPAFSEYFKLDCEIRNYGTNYSIGKGREVAEEWFPPKSTHIIHRNRSYFVEYDLHGSARQQKNRIYFQYSGYDTNGSELTLQYTYLSKKSNLYGISHTGPNYYDMQVYGKCDSTSLSKSEAQEYLPWYVKLL